jgi:hypothetical protein
MALLAGLAVAGAAGAGPPAPTDPSAFHYEPLPAQGTVEVRIDARDPAFEFKTGPSAYRAFRLPAGDAAYLIEVRGLLEGGLDARRAHVFYPVVALLTEDYLLSRQTDVEALRFELPFSEAARSPAYRVSIGVDPAQAKERYLVIYTPAPLLGMRPWPAATTPEAAAEAARGAWAGASGSGTVRITVLAAPGHVAGAPPTH